MLSDGSVTLRHPGEDEVAAALADPEIAAWAGTYVPDENAWLILPPDESRIDGIALLRPDGLVGYVLVEAARGRGLATRAVKLLVAHGRVDRGLSEFVILTEDENLASRAVAERAGFSEAGRGTSADGRDLMRFACKF